MTSAEVLDQLLPLFDNLSRDAYQNLHVTASGSLACSEGCAQLCNVSSTKMHVVGSIEHWHLYQQAAEASFQRQTPVPRNNRLTTNT